LLGLKVHTLADLGAFLTPMTAMIPNSTPHFLAGLYRIEGLAAWRDFAPSGTTFSSGAHIAVVEVDPETGEGAGQKLCGCR